MRQSEFEEISKIIKEGDTDVVYHIDFEPDVLGQDYRKAVLKLDIDGEDKFTLVAEGVNITLNVNDKPLFTVDREHAHKWFVCANIEFMIQFPDTPDDDAEADLADLRIKEEKEDRFFNK